MEPIPTGIIPGLITIIIGLITILGILARQSHNKRKNSNSSFHAETMRTIIELARVVEQNTEISRQVISKQEEIVNLQYKTTKQLEVTGEELLAVTKEMRGIKSLQVTQDEMRKLFDELGTRIELAIGRKAWRI